MMTSAVGHSFCPGWITATVEALVFHFCHSRCQLSLREAGQMMSAVLADGTALNTPIA